MEWTDECLLRQSNVMLDVLYVKVFYSLRIDVKKSAAGKIGEAVSLCLQLVQFY